MARDFVTPGKSPLTTPSSSLIYARPPVCRFEARLALMSAALRACVARERHDDAEAALWTRRADEAREWLRIACGDYDEPKLSLEIAA